MLLGQRVPGCLHMRRLVIQDPPDRGGDPNKVWTAEFPGWEPYMTPSQWRHLSSEKTPSGLCMGLCVGLCVCVCMCVRAHAPYKRKVVSQISQVQGTCMPTAGPSQLSPPPRHIPIWCQRSTALHGAHQGKTSTTQTCKAQAEGKVNHEKQTSDLSA